MASGQEHNLHVRAVMEPAQGFLDLGMFDDAWKALDDLLPEDKAHPLVVLLRMDILMGLRRFDDAVAIGTGACRQWPVLDGFFVKTVSALINLADYEKAKEMLLTGPESLHQKAAYWFDLSRCHCRLREFDLAKKSISECIGRDAKYKQRVLDATDLEAVWNSL